ncbi:phosphate ABC transporter, permease protein PstA, partial [Cloacibacillus evryensis]|nr:phosphate ABC transporter, permease protein PstA [Cloacibacillus evryensis]
AVAAFLIKKGAATLSWEFVSEPPKDGMLAGGILTPLVGTMQLVLVSMGVALPVGIMTGLYFAEYAKDTLIVSLMRISIRSLAGVPSVIFGLFVLSLFV